MPSVVLEDELYTRRVFQVLCRAGSSLISWHDYLDAMSAMGEGNRAKRAAFIFSVYDRQGQGNLGQADLFSFFASSLNIDVPEGYDLQKALLAATQGQLDGTSPLEDLKGQDAKLLACTLFSTNTFNLLDVGKVGTVSLQHVLESLDGLEEQSGKAIEVSALFGRSMLGSLESDMHGLMVGGHQAQQDAAAGMRLTLIKAHKLLLEECLGSGAAKAGHH